MNNGQSSSSSSTLLTSTTATTFTGKKEKTRQKYTCTILDENNQPILPVYVKSSPNVSLAQHFAWCVQFYLNLLNSDKEMDQQTAFTMFVAEIWGHSQGKAITDHPAIIACLHKPVEQIGLLLPILPQLKIPGIKSCTIHTSVVNLTPKKGAPVSQELVNLSPDIQAFMNTLHTPGLSTWKGMKRNFSDSSSEQVAWIRIDENNAQSLSTTYKSLGLETTRLLNKEAGKNNRVLMINIDEIAMHVAARKSAANISQATYKK
ncbi:MAG: hypothetical protein ABSF18_06755 [Gammaproteobacteria bacterium]|jgi:hypothetical protein